MKVWFLSCVKAVPLDNALSTKALAAAIRMMRQGSGGGSQTGMNTRVAHILTLCSCGA